MTQTQLPAHLQNRQVRSLTERAAEGMGSSQPPHVSIQGNSFTFVDAIGNEYAPILTFDAAIVDVSDNMCKRYYDKPFDPNASTYEPPVCWSANGIGPSREATKPQSPTCADCPMNERGSAVSRVSGASIKACRDERWIAILHPQMPTMVFQFVITPGSFKNWKAYTETFRNFGVELSLGLTRFSFVPKKTGEILFEHVGWIEAATADAVEASVREKKTDAIVGRLDQPRGHLTGATAGAVNQIVQQTIPPVNQMQLAPAQQVQQPAQEVIPPSTPFAPSAGPQQNASPGLVLNQAGPAQTAESSSAPQPRRRRTRAEIEAANSTAQPGPANVQQPFQPAGAPTAAFQPANAPQAPFPTGQAEQAALGPAGPAPQFGMAPGAAMNPEMLKMLADLGFTKQG